MADVIEFDEEGNLNHIQESGVSRGLDAVPFHWVNRQTGKSPLPEPFYALGRRNLEFRRAEAEKAGYDFVECGENCPHH